MHLCAKFHACVIKCTHYPGFRTILLYYIGNKLIKTKIMQESIYAAAINIVQADRDR